MGLNFLELHSTNANRRCAVNIDSIRLIEEMVDTNTGEQFCKILFKCLSGDVNAVGRFPSGIITVRETYDQIKAKLEGL